MSVEEDIHEVHLSDDVDEVEKLTEDELVHVYVVGADIVSDVVHDDVPLLLGCRPPDVQGDGLEVLEQEPQPPSLPALPEEVREVAGEGLEEEDEDDPLVPGVPDLVPVLGDRHQVPVLHLGQGRGARVRTHARVSVVNTSPGEVVFVVL